MSGIPAARTILLMGFIQQIPVQILVDSNSSSSFINVSLVSQLQDIQVYALPSSIQVTGGSMLVSQSILRNVRWAVDSCTF
jgi:hypothetical protein